MGRRVTDEGHRAAGPRRDVRSTSGGPSGHCACPGTPRRGLVVLSLWREDRCVGTFRLEAEEVPALVNALVTGLAAAAADGQFRPASRDVG